jgi:hypothetical protein
MVAVLGTAALAADMDPQKLFETKCAACHITDLSKMGNKSALIAPPADEIIAHAKEEFGADKAKAVKSMAEYIRNPDPKKTFCASIEYFGAMPTQKDAITPQEAEAIVGMMFDKYPRSAFTEQEDKEGNKHTGMTFEKLDRNHDGVIVAKEYQLFRAEKNRVDPARFVNTYYFDRLDLNGDGKMDEAEFDKMKAEKRKKKKR